MLRCAVLVAAVVGIVGACSRGKDPGPDPTGEPDAGPGTPDPVVFCETPVPAAQTGACDVTAGSATIALRGDVLAPDKVFVDGTVIVEGDQITCVGCDCDGAGATVVACAGAAISPGLINAHDHLTFTEGHPIDHGAERYDHRHGWRGSLSTPSNPHGTGQAGAGMRWGEIRMALSGVTSMVGSGRAENLIRNLDNLVEGEATRGIKPVEFETFSLGDNGEQYRANCTWNYKMTEQEVAELDTFLPHVAEGIDDYAAEEFRCQSTSFAGGQDYTERNATHIHSIGLFATDYLNMARDQTRLLWSPRSNISLYGHTAQVTLFDRLGGVIALGTDWTYSGSANLLRELACADQLNRDYYDRHFSDGDLWRMVTVNAAIATGNEELLGALAPGKLADIAIFAGTSDRKYHRAVLEAGNEDVALVMMSGRPFAGEADVVSDLGETCDPVDVCGQDRVICVSREVGVSYATIAAEVAMDKPAYPALFCGEIADEPTCVPSRPGEFTGELRDGDGDGDGVADGSDNCPRVFNAVRPIDGGKQPDLDDDGQGDACDSDPLVADLDADGTPNDSDNCPFDANADQADTDDDGKGNTCDFCPELANPISVCSAGPPQEVTVMSIQMGQMSVGTSVTVRNAVVTGFWANGVFIQDPSGGGEYSGIHVFTGPTASVAIGDRVDASGKVFEYFGETELEQATITRTGTATPIAPTPITVAQAMDERYEGVLVRLTDVTQSVNPYSCAQDNPSCADPNLWQVNSSVVVWDRLYRDADWAAQATQVPVTGVMTFRFDRRRIMPRTTGDLGP